MSHRGKPKTFFFLHWETHSFLELLKAIHRTNMLIHESAARNILAVLPGVFGTTEAWMDLFSRRLACNQAFFRFSTHRFLHLKNEHLCAEKLTKLGKITERCVHSGVPNYSEKHIFNHHILWLSCSCKIIDCPN